MQCVESLRLEKGYRVWGSDLTADYTPYEAGLGFCVDLNKKGGFIGRDALVKAKADGPRRRLITLTVEAAEEVADLSDQQQQEPQEEEEQEPEEGPPTIRGKLYGGEAILHGGEVVGVTSSGAYCHTIQKHVLLGYVPTELAAKNVGWCVHVAPTRDA
jgi:4-methylaminobutanoate oxidase (formaldehyde-forming)